MHFETSFITLEADSERKYYPEIMPEGLRYEYMKDKDEVFHRTKYINKLIAMSSTPYIGVWDADAIAPPLQIHEAVNKLRSNEAVLSFPYDGRFYSCEKVLCDLFKKHINIDTLIKRLPAMNLMHVYHSVGGAYIVNKEKYIEAGGENENFYGWGPEDVERVKRLEIKELNIFYTKGPLFHLCHPIKKNSRFANADIERRNRKELLLTCKKIK